VAAHFDPQTLTQIGRYTVVRFLAEGGMSWVFEVSDPEMYDRRVALKLIKPHVLAEGEMLKRYEDEVRLLALIEHPNLVRVYAQGTDAETGARFFTMEFIEGPHLGEVAAEWLLERGATTVGVTVASLAEIGDFFLGILSALARVHAQGVFHRDIKPENILITQDGIAKLADFSIARDTHKAGVTRAGLVPGTPQYMSPEQSLDETVGATSDLFSLGLTLYRVLTGHSIYAIELGDETKTQQVIRHLWALYTNKGEFRFEFPDELPVAFHEVVRRACRIDRAARFQTALEMREALSRALAGPHQATVPLPLPPRAPRRAPEPEAPPRSRRGLMLGVAGVAGVALLGGLIAVIGIPRPWGGSGNAAAELLERTRGRSEQVTRLVDWLKARPDESARALAVQAGGDLRRFSEDVDQAATDVKDGYAELALRQLDRADQGFATLCDRFTSEYLEGTRASAEGAARDEYARVTDEARSLAAPQTEKLEAEFEHLSAEIGTRGCDRAEGMRARIETAALVRELAAGVLRSAEETLPASVDAAILKAEAAAAKARQPAITNEHYRARLREGDEALERARAAQAAREWRPALEAAALATESLERTALIGSAALARAATEELVQELDAIEAPLGAMRLAFESAQRSFSEGEWQTAQSGFAGLAPELRERLEAATPVIEVARRQAAACEPARVRGTAEDTTELDQSELDARAKFRAAKFAEATALYGEIEAQCAQIVALADQRQAEQAETEKAERTKLGELAAQKSRAEAAKARAQKSLAALTTAKIGAANLAAELATANSLFGESRFEESARAYAALDAEASALANQSKAVIALREQVKNEFRSAQSAGLSETTLAAGSSLRDAGLGLLTAGDLDGAREKFEGALAAYKKVRGEFEAEQAAELAKREKLREVELQASREAEHAVAAERETASKPRDQLARRVSELQAKGLPLGPVGPAQARAEAAFNAKKYDEAARAFERASELASQQLEAGAPVLAARVDAQAARERALSRGASGKLLTEAAKRFDAATAQLSAGKLSAALAGFRGAIASYDATDADPEEIVKLLLSNWDLAWSERDIGLLRRTQSLSAAQEKGFAKVFDDNDSITQRTRVLGVTKAGANAYEVQLEYDRRLQAGASVKEQKGQKRIARVEKSGAAWVIATVTQK
jgi:hypothetical protein